VNKNNFIVLHPNRLIQLPVYRISRIIRLA